MTAIAYRDGVMAADTQVTGGYFVRGHNTKIARSAKGTLGAASGNAGACDEFRRQLLGGWIDRWIENGYLHRLGIEAPEGCFGAIVVQVSGVVTCIDWQGYAVAVGADFYVEGSAEAILTGALAAGASAEAAVRIAIEYDTGCGGEVQVERLGARDGRGQTP